MSIQLIVPQGIRDLVANRAAEPGAKVVVPDSSVIVPKLTDDDKKAPSLAGQVAK